MDINPKIFRAYDVRGIYGQDINEEIFCQMGRIFSAYTKAEKIILGRDLRTSSPSLSCAFVKGVLEQGSSIINIGQSTSPMLYFAANKLGGPGAMITASHNPLEYNGLKFISKNGLPITGQEIKKFLKEFRPSRQKIKPGKEEGLEISEDYLNFITEDFKTSRQFRIKIDAQNSAVAILLERFLTKLKIKEEQSDLDFSASFDPDADRLKIQDEKEREVRGDILGGIIADGFLKKGDRLIYNLVSTRAVRDYFENRGIKTFSSRTGHYYIKEAMKKRNADFGVEISGHYYFKSLNYVESALLALRKILEALDKNPGKSISDLAKPFQKYFHSGEINLPLSSGEEWARILKKIKERYRDGKQNLEDGILTEYQNWWFNLRPSNTEPLLRLTIEAQTKELLKQHKTELLSFIKTN